MNWRNKMADITMCENWKCPSSKNCYRYQAEPHPFWQYYMKFEPIEGEVRCPDYIPCGGEDECSSQSL